MSDVDRQSSPKGMELFETKPIIVGGDPTDVRNKVWLTRQQHFECCALLESGCQQSTR